MYLRMYKIARAHTQAHNIYYIHILNDYQIGGVNNSLVSKGSEASGVIIYVTVTTPHMDQPRRVQTIDIFLWLYI